MTNQDPNRIVRITAEAFSASFDQNWITRAQEKKSASRNAMFGILMNEPFIEVTTGKKTSLVSLVQMYGSDDASDIVSLVIYNLANPSGFVKPTVARI